ncbi:MAG: glycosyltransferase family 39 protein [Patescibacteria group bacterium]
MLSLHNFKNFFDRHDILILCFLFLLGGVLRFLFIADIPCGIFPDQASHGLDALRFSHGHISPVYGTNEGLFIYLVALSHFFFGTGMWQLFVVSAGIGTATIATTYLAVKAYFGRKTASITGFLLAVSSWHIALSRNGFRAILIPFIITLLVFFFHKLLTAITEKQRIKYYSLVGFIFALGFYTYNAYVLFAVAVFLLTIFYGILHRKKIGLYIRTNKKPLIAALAVFCVVILPLVLFIVLFPSKYFGRASQVSIFTQMNGAANIAAFIIHNFWDTFIGIFTQGDLNWRHNPAGKPLLFPLLTPFFASGLIYAFFRWKKYAPLLIIFFMMMIPAAITKDGVPPHSLRLIGIIPAVFIFPAITLAYLLEYPKSKALKIGSTVLVGVILAAAAWSGYRDYFGVAPVSQHYYDDFRCDLPKAASYLRQHNGENFIIISDNFSYQSLKYLLYPVQVGYITPEVFLASTRKWLDEEYAFVVPFSYSEKYEEMLKFLRQHYKAEFFTGPFGGVDFSIFRSKP